MSGLQQRRLSSLFLLTTTTTSPKTSSFVKSLPLRQLSSQKHQNSSIKSTIKKSNLICTFSELPAWMKDNSAIIRGYRRPTFSYIKCVKSLFYLHNESVNIWSHFFGAVIFLLVSIATSIYVLPEVELFETIAFYCFLLGAMICLGLSSLFHAFSCHSEKVCANWNRCDYIGIVALIAGSNVPLVYYGLYCDYLFKSIYIILMSLFSAATISVAVSSKFRTPEFRWFRTSLFTLLGSSSLLPILHSILIYGIDLSYKIISLKWVILSGSLYIIGAILYGSRIPERLSPGTFDIWGSSHQIFHFFVVKAALVTYYGIFQSMTYWHEMNNECKLSVESMKQLHFLSNY